MTISVDWADTQIIDVELSDLTLVSGTVYTFDTDAFRLTLKDLEDDADGMPWPRTHDHNTEVTIFGTTFARQVIILPPYSVRFPDQQISVILQGSNNNIADVANGILVQNQAQVIPTNSAGLTAPGFTDEDRIVLNYLKNINQKIFVNTELVAAGDGSARTPYNNIADALDDAEANGIRELVFLADATLDRNLKNFSVEGLGLAVIDMNGQDTTGTTFRDIRVRGASTATNFWSIIVGGFDDGTSGVFGGYIDVNWVGTVTMAAGGVSLFTNVAPAPLPGFTPTFAMPSGAFHQSSIENLLSDLTLTGFDFALHTLEITMIGGTVTIDNTCTAGTIRIRGTGKVIDNSAGTTVDTTGLVDPTQLRESWTRLGLNPDDPFTDTPTQMSSQSGDIVVDLTGDGETSTTQTRQ